MPDALTALPSSITSLFQQSNGPVRESKGDKLDRSSFLTLLTTQLQNQNPLEPLSNEEFISQLTTFSSLEQLQSMNSKLESVYVGIAAMNNASMASLLGTDIIARGDEFHYDGSNSVNLHYSAPPDTASAMLSVYDSSGRLVDSRPLGELADGEGAYLWDGQGMNGEDLPEGIYRFQIDGSTPDGQSVNIEERIEGTITEMDYSTGAPLPSLDGVVIDLGNIIRLTTGAASSGV
jgi:flagellar basal-body rod modification protein FlgD